MAIKIGGSAPDFEAKTTDGIIRFYDWLKGCWCLFITHPSEFTPVCATELIRMASLKEELNERNVKTIALSVNTLLSHLAWLKNRDNLEERIIQRLCYPFKLFMISTFIGKYHNYNAVR